MLLRISPLLVVVGFSEVAPSATLLLYSSEPQSVAEIEMYIMNSIVFSASRKLAVFLTVWALTQPTSSRANVYATNFKLNGSKAPLSSPQGRPVSINYILNEAATGGVSIDISSGTNLVRSLLIEAGANGTLRGENTVSWDGRDHSGNLAPEGVYSFRITAESLGHAGWTLISEDHRTNNYVFRGTGIAVNQDPNSVDYGRVYVANADNGPNAGLPGAKPGEHNSVLQFNAASSPTEVGSIAIGQGWSGFGESPWKIETLGDHIYVNDLFYAGEVFRWDSTFADTSRVAVLTAANFPNSAARLGGLAVTGSAGSTQLYVSDLFEPSSGIHRYLLNAQGQVPQGSTGEVIVGITNSANAIDVAPYDVAVDTNGNIYAVQYRFNAGDPSPRLLKFSPTGTNSLPMLEALWAVGQGDDTMGRASGVAVDPSGQFVAVAFRGIDGPEFDWINGGTGIFAASNGVLITNLDLSIDIGGEIIHQDTDVAWDAVGNVYYIDDYVQLWRTFSPPGANESTTASPWSIEITPPVDDEPPQIGSITINASTVTITFIGTPGVPASNYQVLGAASANGPYNPVAGATIAAGSSPGQYVATLPVAGAMSFYRILAGDAPPVGDAPVLTAISVEGNTVNIRFTSSPSDTPGVFTLLSSATANGTFAPAQGASIAAGTVSGEFRASVPVSGPIQFYQVLK